METTPSISFMDLALPESLKKSLAKMNFLSPTAIQEQTLPLALEGRDVIGCAQTGTGKTGAFMVPTVARLIMNPGQTALIMTPTRELALQIFEVARNLVWFDPDMTGALLIGGAAYGPQFNQLRRNPRIVIGTPGRIQDHLNQGSLRIDQTGVLILDEADRMLDMGFAPQIEEILRGVPENRQTYLFTATLPREIERMAQKFMKSPTKITVGDNSRPIEKIKQEVIETTEGKKFDLLINQLNAREGSVLIFAKTKIRTDKLTDGLANLGFTVTSIHGDKSQRHRADAVSDFKRNKVRILVATDVAARGLDVPHIAHVINYDLPQVPEDFIHRIGRTARAGAEGNALSLVTPGERGLYKRIHRLITGDNNQGYDGGDRPYQNSSRPRSYEPSGPRSSNGRRYDRPTHRGPASRGGERPAFNSAERPGFNDRPVARGGFNQGPGFKARPATAATRSPDRAPRADAGPAREERRSPFQMEKARAARPARFDDGPPKVGRFGGRRPGGRSSSLSHND